MQIIIVTDYKKKLKMLAFLMTVWLLLFILGGYIIDNVLLYNITVGSFVEFSYPDSIVVDNVMAKSTLTDSKVITSFAPIRPRTGQFTNYKSLEGNFSFDYPSAFEISEETFEGGEILYHIGFHDKQNISHGFVQVWRLNEKLDEFLKKSMNSSQNKFKYFNSENIELNGEKGYYWDYSVSTQDGYYKGSEIFLSNDGRMYRMSYFMPEDNWDENQSEIFWKMARSFRIR